MLYVVAAVMQVKGKSSFQFGLELNTARSVALVQNQLRPSLSRQSQMGSSVTYNKSINFASAGLDASNAAPVIEALISQIWKENILYILSASELL